MKVSTSFNNPHNTHVFSQNKEIRNHDYAGLTSDEMMNIPIDTGERVRGHSAPPADVQCNVVVVERMNL